MSEPLSAERFEQFVDAYAANHGDVIRRLDKIDSRLDRIEKHLWNEERLVEHERRIIKLAETVGRPDLSIPFDRPIGS